MTTDDTPLDVEHLRSWIGREETAFDMVTADLTRKYCATLSLPGDTPRDGEVAPRLIHLCLAQPAVGMSALGDDGHPRRGGFLPPVPLPRRMWAGGGFEFHDDLRVGDAVRRVSRIADVVAKEGRTGLLCFVTVEHAFDVGGRVVLNERQDLVYRDAGAGGPKKDPPPAEHGADQRRIDPTSTLLFRYSAITFNGHRIHYDRSYATEVEGYPGLVVHGPMQAAMLVSFATELRGAPPRRFEFRSVSPLFDTEPFLLHAKVADEGLELWTARENGPVAMSAQAEW